MRRIINKLVKPVYAHCDLPCGIYDPVQALVEAKSIVEIMKKYPDLHEEDKIRAVFIKEQRAELVKQHLWVLWTDYFKPEHLDKYPDLHNTFWQATKQAGKTKKTFDVQEGETLITMINNISDIFWQTKKV
jgi:nickel superoxide dismutase